MISTNIIYVFYLRFLNIKILSLLSMVSSNVFKSCTNCDLHLSYEWTPGSLRELYSCMNTNNSVCTVFFHRPLCHLFSVLACSFWFVFVESALNVSINVYPYLISNYSIFWYLIYSVLFLYYQFIFYSIWSTI